MDLQEIEVAKLRPNDYNFNEMPNAQLKELAAEIKRRGFVMHHVVARLEGDAFIIVDGEHQWRAAQLAGLATVPVQLVEVSPAEAIAESYRRNGLRGEANRVKLARAIRRMQAETPEADGKPMPNTKAGDAIGRSEAWVRTTLEYGILADLASGNPAFPNEDKIAKLNEKDMKKWFAYARGDGPHPDGKEPSPLVNDPAQSTMLDDPDTPLDGGPVKPEKPEVTDDEKAAKVIEGIIRKLEKLTPADRAHVSKAIARLDRESKKVVKAA